MNRYDSGSCTCVTKEKDDTKVPFICETISLFHTDMAHEGLRPQQLDTTTRSQARSFVVSHKKCYVSDLMYIADDEG